MSNELRWTTIRMNGNLKFDVGMPPEEVVASFHAANVGKDLHAGSWWSPWPNLTIRLDQVVAICPRNSEDGNKSSKGIT